MALIGRGWVMAFFGIPWRIQTSICVHFGWAREEADLSAFSISRDAVNEDAVIVLPLVQNALSMAKIRQMLWMFDTRFRSSFVWYCSDQMWFSMIDSSVALAKESSTIFEAMRLVEIIACAQIAIQIDEWAVRFNDYQRICFYLARKSNTDSSAKNTSDDRIYCFD